MRTWKRVLALMLALIMLVPGGVTALAAEDALQAEEALGEEAALTPEEAPEEIENVPEAVPAEKPETAELAAAGDADDDSKDYPVYFTNVSAPSQQVNNSLGGDGADDAAVDNDISTFWHSKWSNFSLVDKQGSSYIQLELANPTKLAGLRYYPRSDNSNLHFEDYAIWAYNATSGAAPEVQEAGSSTETVPAEDGGVWTKVASGNWGGHSLEWKRVDFTYDNEVKWLRLYSTSNHQFMGAAEIHLVMADDAGYTFSGTVMTNDSTPVAVAGATITVSASKQFTDITDTPTKTMVVDTVTVQSDGSFTTRKLPTGSYTYTVVKNGYTVVSGVDDGALTIGTTNVSKEIVMQAQNKTINVAVKDSNGNAFTQAATLTLETGDFAATESVTFTDDDNDGTWTFTGPLSAGNYRVKVSAGQAGGVGTSASFALDNESATTANTEVTLSGEILGTHYTMAADNRLALTASNNNSSVEDVEGGVRLSFRAGRGSYVASAPIFQNGTIEFDATRAVRNSSGRADTLFGIGVGVESTGKQVLISDWYGDNARTGWAMDYMVSAGDSHAWSASGNANTPPFKGGETRHFKVSIVDGTVSLWVDGVASITNQAVNSLSHGSYEAPNYVPTKSGIGFASDTASSSDDDVVTISDLYVHRTDAQHTVSMAENANVTLTAAVGEDAVTLGSGQVYTGDTVTLTTTPADNYAVTEVAVSYGEGTAVTVTAVTAGQTYSFPMPDGDATVTVTTVERNRTISGKVTTDTEGNNPLEEATVTLVSNAANKAHVANSPTATTGADGTYTLNINNLAAGTYRIRVSKPGYGAVIGDDAAYDITVAATENTETYADKNAVLPEIKAPEGTTKTLSYDMENTKPELEIKNVANKPTSSFEDGTLKLHFNDIARENNLVKLVGTNVKNGTIEFDAHREGTYTKPGRFGLALRLTGADNWIFVGQWDSDSNWATEYWYTPNGNDYSRSSVNSIIFGKGDTRHFKVEIADTTVTLTIDGNQILSQDLTVANKTVPSMAADVGFICGNSGSGVPSDITIDNLYIFRQDPAFAVNLTGDNTANLQANIEVEEVLGDLVDGTKAAAGDKVVISAKGLDASKVLSGITVKKAEDETVSVTVTPGANETFSFLMPEYAVNVTGTIEERTWKVPLYGKLVIDDFTKAGDGVTAASVAAALANNEFVKAAESEGTVTLVGIKATTANQTIVDGCNYKLVVDGTGVTAENVSVYAGRDVYKPTTGTAVDYNADTSSSNVTAAVVSGDAAGYPINQTVTSTAKAKQGTGSNTFSDEAVSLTTALYTFTQTDTPNTFTIKNGDSCLKLNGDSATIPNGDSANNIAIAAVENSTEHEFTIQDKTDGNQRYLYFHKNAAPHFNRQGSVDNNCKFLLYRPAKVGENTASSAINGYVQVTALADVTEGVYLIVAHSTDATYGGYYVLYPGASSEWTHVAKVDASGADSVSTSVTWTASKALKFTGVAKTDTPVLVVAGGKGYNVSVRAVPTNTVTFDLTNATVSEVKVNDVAAEGNSPYTVPFDATVTFQVTAADHYTLGDVKMGEETLTAAEGVYTVKMASADVTISNTATQNQTAAPEFAVNGDSYTMKYNDKTATFTLSAASTATYKVYAAETGGEAVSGVTAEVSGTTLTLTFDTAPSETTNYWISATAEGERESATRTQVTVNPYVAKTMTVTVTGNESAIVYDKSAHTITLTVKEGDTTISDATITYKTTSEGAYGETKPEFTDAGTYTIYYKVVKAGYVTVEDSAAITISKADPTVTAPVGKTDLVYSAAEQELLQTKATTTGGTLQYKVDEGEYSENAPKATTAGEHTVYYKVVGGDNYNDVAEKSITVNIAKAKVITATAPAKVENLTYTGSAQTLVTAGTASAGGKMQYKLDPGEYGDTVPTATNAGTYTVYYKAVTTDTTNYEDGDEASVTVSIAKATPVVTAPTVIESLVYNNGNDMALVNAGSTTVGTLLYSVDDGEYSTNVPKASAAGTYTVHYKVEGDTNWNAVADATITVTIANASQNAPEANEGYTIDFTAETITINDGYEVSATENDFTTQVASGASVTPGKDLYIRKAAKENYDASAAATITVPARGTVAENAVTVSYLNETVTVPTGYKYVIKDAQASDTAHDACTESGAGTPVAFGPGKYLYVYKEATASAFKTEVKEIAAAPRPAATSVTIDYANETLNTAATMQYKVGEGAWTTCTADMSVSNAAFGWDGTAAVTVKFREAAVKDTSYAGEEQEVTIKARPAAPEASNFSATAPETAGASDGEIAITSTTDLEYKVGSAGTYGDVSASPITGLAGDATVYFRVKATNADFASVATEVHVPQYVAHDQTPAPAFTSKIVTFAKGATTVTFTLTNYEDGNTYKVYTAATDGEIASGGYPQISVDTSSEAKTLTLTFDAQPGGKTMYYVTATNATASKTESPRTELTVNPYVVKNIATLQGLTVTADGHAVELTPSFATDSLNYTAQVANSVTSVTVTATVSAGSDATAVVKVSDAVKDGGVVNDLAVGVNTITVTVTAEDGSTTKDYVITLTRDKAKTATPTFQATSYQMTTAEEKAATFTVTNDAAATTYKVFEAEENGSEVNGVTAAISEKTLTLTFTTAPAADQILWIQAENDGEYASARTQVTVKKYVKSTEARLASLSLGEGVTLSPAFDAGTFSYTATVENEVDSVTVTATAAGQSKVTSGTGSQSLSVGANEITVVVTAEDGTSTKNYVITVTRKKAVTAAPSFTATSFTMTTADMKQATFTVDGAAANTYKVYDSASATEVSAGVSAAISGNMLTLTFTSAPKEDKTLYISAQKDGEDESTDRTQVTVTAYVVGTKAQLASLSLGASVTLTPAFDAGTFEYTATVENDVTSVTVSATAKDKATVDAGTIGAKSLNVGENTITVTVTAEDGTTTQDYVIKVTRKANKTALATAIANATAAKTDVTVNSATDVADVAKGVKFVSQAEMDALNTAIATAEAMNNKVNATQDEVDGAVTALNNAVTTFNAAIKTGTKVVLTALEVSKDTVDLVGTASDTVTVTTTPADATDELEVESGNAAVATASITGNTITITGVGAGTTTITVRGKSATGVTATITVTVTMDKTALETAIANATAAKEGVVTGTDASQVEKGTFFASAEAIAALESAITAATEVKNNAEATDAEVAQAVTDLTAAISTFNAAKAEGTKVTLTGITVDATASVYVGKTVTVTAAATPDNTTDTLAVSSGDDAIATATIDQATKVITIEGKAKGTVVITVSGTSATGVTATITVTVTVDKSALADAIAAAETTLGSVQVGESAETVPSGTQFVTQATKDALTAAIDAAKAVNEDAEVTAQQVSDAVTALNEAKATFKGAIMTGSMVIITVSPAEAQNVSVNVGEAINLAVTATVEPDTVTATYAWTKDGVALDNTTASFAKESAAVEDSGVYVCTVSAEGAESKTVTFNVTVNGIPEVPVTVQGYNGVYDGEAHGITVTSDVPGAVVRYGALEGVYTLTASPTRTDAGSVTVYYQVTAPGYETVTGSANIIIAKASVTMTVDAAPNNIHSANVADRLVLFTVGGVPEGGEVTITCDDAGIAVSNGSVILPDETMTYVFTAKFAGDNNHEPAEAQCIVVVTKSDVVLQDMTGVSAENVTAEYDGQAKTITVTGAPEGAVITYCDTENGTYTQTQPAIVNVGTHTMYYKVSAAGYNTFTGSATITINKGDPNMTITPDKPELSGGGVVKFTVAVPGEGTVNVICDDATVTVTKNDDGTFTATLPNVTKDYTFTATYGGDVNHKPGSAYCAVVVTAVEDLDAVVAADKAKVERGSYRTTQAKAPTQEKAVAEAERLMAELGISSETIVNVEEYVAAVAGTASNKSGQNGKLVFTATLHKDGAADVTTKTLTMTITATAYSGGTSSGGDGTRPSGGGTPSQGNIVKTENPDGSVTTVATDRKGNVTETTEKPDGTVEVIVTKVDGTVTATITQPDGGKVEAVTIPDEGKTITVTDNQGEVTASVSIPAVVAEPEAPFVDVPENHWAQKAINTIHGLGLVKGVDEEAHIYDMTSPMTRGALVTVLHRFSNGATDLDSTFEDVAEDAWYADGVAWAAKNGVVTGYSEDTFAPDDTITRQQIAVMLYRYAKLLGVDVTVDEDVYVDSFGDADQIGDWALNAMEWAYASGLIQGRGGNQLAPTANATRAEVATILARFIDMLK